MLASINPLGERARHQRYCVTVSAYVLGSVAAGGLLGATLGALGTRIAGPYDALWALAAVGIVGHAFDSGVLGVRVPGPRRQVDENWLVKYRGWVYGVGFGAQLGIGVATIVTASATWVAFASAFFAGTPVAGAVIGSIFGFARALPLFASARVRDPSALRAVARRLEQLRPRVATGTTAAQAASCVALIVIATRPWS